jgi:uncharacterized protein
MRIISARTAFLALMLSWSCAGVAQVAVPTLTGHVIDQTGTLNAEQIATLEQSLQAFERRKGSQLAVLIVPGVAPETIEQYALRVAEKWKLGRKKVDDGAIVVVSKDDHTMRIEVGYGLEGALNDAVSKRIVSEIITPRFQEQDFYGGISAGLDQIVRVVDGESLAEPTRASPDRLGNIGQLGPIIFILALVIGGLLRSVIGRFPGAVATGGIIAVLAWFFVGAASVALVAGVIALLVSLLSGGMGGMGVGGRRGGMILGGFGGGALGGGGFGGGGGGFGGGGASGRW